MVPDKQIVRQVRTSHAQIRIEEEAQEALRGQTESWSAIAALKLSLGNNNEVIQDSVQSRIKISGLLLTSAIVPIHS